MKTYELTVENNHCRDYLSLYIKKGSYKSYIGRVYSDDISPTTLDSIINGIKNPDYSNPLRGQFFTKLFYRIFWRIHCISSSIRSQVGRENHHLTFFNAKNKKSEQLVLLESINYATNNSVICTVDSVVAVLNQLKKQH